ncbi:MAG: transposase [Nitrospira sp.]
MKRPKFSEERIVYTLRQMESTTSLSDLCRQHGIAEQLFPARKKKLDEVNSWLKRLVADLAGYTYTVGGLVKKKLRPAHRRELAHWFRDTFSVSCARACHLAQFSRAALHRKSRDKGRTALRLRMRDLAHATPQFGYRRIWVWLRREGWVIKRKQVRRLHRLDGLHLFMRVRRRKHIALHRGPAPIPTGPMERWSMDFVHDTLADGRPILILTIVDHWSRSSPVVEMGGRMSGERIGWIPGRMTANWTLRR